jgi:hypothetical protein
LRPSSACLAFVRPSLACCRVVPHPLRTVATLFSSKPRVEQIKKKSAETSQAVKETVKAKAAEAQAAVQDTVAAAQDKAADVQTNVQKRTAAGKAKANEEL